MDEPFEYLVFSYAALPDDQLVTIKQGLDVLATAPAEPFAARTDAVRHQAQRRSEAIQAVFDSRRDQERFKESIFQPLPVEIMTPSKVLAMLVAAPEAEHPSIASHLRSVGGLKGTDSEVIAKHRKEIEVQIS
jgi:hypothetical protein